MEPNSSLSAWAFAPMIAHCTDTVGIGIVGAIPCLVSRRVRPSKWRMKELFVWVVASFYRDELHTRALVIYVCVGEARPRRMKQGLLI